MGFYVKEILYVKDKVRLSEQLIWSLMVAIAILMWAATSLLYKASVQNTGVVEEHTPLKYYVCVGTVYL